MHTEEHGSHWGDGYGWEDTMHTDAAPRPVKCRIDAVDQPPNVGSVRRGAICELARGAARFGGEPVLAVEGWADGTRRVPATIADGTRSVPATIADGTRRVPATIKNFSKAISIRIAEWFRVLAEFFV
jgi:hypothetical protein